MQERRSEVRHLCSDLVQLCWKDDEGKKRRTPALLEDISASGACLQTEVPVRIGASVHWRTPKKDFTGWVRYCKYREIGYFVGVEFDSVSKWSKSTFEPRHLLDVSRLLRH